MIVEERYTLTNGVELPKLGLGTWLINNADVVQTVIDALKFGYRHLDTAQAYRNKRGVGQGLRAGGVPRDQVFVTSKVDAGAKSYQKAAASIDRSLSALGVDYLDLMLIHSPQPWTQFRTDKHYFDENREVWRALEDAYQAGKLRAIGLSNFEQADVDNILHSATVAPMINQVLAHVGNMPRELVEYCQRHGILVEAYSPVAHGQLLARDDVRSIAERYGVSTVQLSLRYLLQLGLLPLPKTTNPDHMRANADLDFAISDADIAALDAVEPVTDYGRDGFMPVFGGRLTLGSMVGMMRRSLTKA